MDCKSCGFYLLSQTTEHQMGCYAPDSSKFDWRKNSCAFKERIGEASYIPYKKTKADVDKEIKERIEKMVQDSLLTREQFNLLYK